MSDAVQAARDLVDRRYKTALLYMIPFFIGVGLLLLDSVWGVSVLASPLVRLWIIVGLLIGAIPVLRYGRAKKAYDREMMLRKLTTIAEAFEQKQ